MEGTHASQAPESFTTAWSDSVTGRKRRDADFPDSLGTPGKESQSLTPSGKLKTANTFSTCSDCHPGGQSE